MPEVFSQPRPRPKKSSFTRPPPKKRKTDHAIEEISFDFDKRADYLTGFHKRKVARAKQAQEEAATKAKEERIVQRRQLREERKQELEEHVKAVNALLEDAKIPGIDFEDEEGEDGWGGLSDDEDDGRLEKIDREEEYIDEDKYTTVTVESVDVSKHGLERILGEDEESEETIEGRKKAEAAKKAAEEEASKKKVWPKKEKKKKFRYESKQERRFTREKAKAGRRAKADARRGTD